MMGYTKDLWTKPARLPDGTVKRDAKGREVREPNARSGKGKRWLAGWTDPDGNEQTKAFANQVAATRHWKAMETDVERGEYIDPKAGKETFGDVAQRWLKSRDINKSSRTRYRFALDNHVAPAFGKRSVKSVNDKPSAILDLINGLSPSSRAIALHIIQGTLELAKLDGAIKTNKARGLQKPRSIDPVDPRTIWTDAQVWGVHDNLPDWLQLVVTLGAGTGLREGELYGASMLDIDGDWLHVRRQIKYQSGRYVFALPKGGKVRKVPLSPGVLAAIESHTRRFKPSGVTLPMDGQPETHPLILSHPGGRRAHLTAKAVSYHWNRALVSAGLIPEPTERYKNRHAKYETDRHCGRHALRHYYASVELADGGEGRIKALSQWLGHSSSTITLEIYTHVLPDTEHAGRSAVDRRLFRPRLIAARPEEDAG